ncbi:DUF4174 domain-containing protein [Kordia sp.]|uniref:DUF4174 domain-containing protein n=1 Tax=Kordia sp. TaxID=1965332 RepID=UPI003D6C26E5
MKIGFYYIFIILSFGCMNSHAQDLNSHQWENRIIIVKTTDIASEKFQAQLNEFKNVANEMIERKFVFYMIVGDDFTFINYKDLTLNNVGKIYGKLAKILNDKYDFEIILIGLDGGIKLKQVEVITYKKLFDKVDSMPMRSNEIRRKQKKN